MLSVFNYSIINTQLSSAKLSKNHAAATFQNLYNLIPKINPAALLLRNLCFQ